ncbi:MAG: alpha/beta hydrolase [Dehalococcoidia bacterium]
MPTLHANGIHLYYEVHGSGPAVVFAHGAGGNHLSWWQQIPHFRDRYRCITFDHRAFGRSHDLTGEGRQSFARDVEALLQHLGEHSCAIVAHSMGGRTAIGVTFRTGIKVWAMVLSGTNGGAVNDEVRAIQDAHRAALPPGSTLLDRALGKKFVAEQPELSFLYREIQRQNPPRPADFLAPAPGYRGSTAERLATSGIPLLFLVGDDDQVVPAKAIEACHRATPGSRFVCIKDAGHSSYFEQPAAFNAAVGAFLDEHADRASGGARPEAAS